MLKKSIAVLTAVAAIASASSVFAADYADQVVKLTDSEKAETLTDTTAQYTVVIVDKKTGNEAVTLSADDLYYINQGTSADTFWTNMGTKTALTAGKTYTIRIGSNAEDFEVQEYDFTVGGNTIIYGDLNDDNTPDISDANILLRHCAQLIELTAKQEQAADLNGDSSIDISDANVLLRYCAQLIESLPEIK